MISRLLLMIKLESQASHSSDLIMESAMPVLRFFLIPLSNPLQPRFERSSGAVVNLALPEHCSARANQPELPAVGLGVKHH